MKKNSLISIIILIIGLILGGCGLFYYNNVNNLEKIEVFLFEKNNIELKIFEYQKIPLKIIPTKYSNEVIYSVSDNSIIEIVNNEYIKGIKAGVTELKATIDNKIIKIPVKVLDVDNLYFDDSKIIMSKEETYQLNIKGNFDFNEKDIKYTVLDNNILFISKTGEIKALKEGKTIVIATYNDIKVSIEVIVSNNYHKITYDLNGATSISKNNDFCYDDKTSCEIILPNITRNGKNVSIIGWSSDKNDKEKQYNIGDKIELDRNVTLYAITKVTYTANFYKNGIKEIQVKDNNGWKDNNDFISTTCYIYNNEKECSIISPIEVIADESYKKVIGFSQNDQTIKLNQQVKLNEEITNFYPIIKTDNSKILTPMKNYEFPKPISVNEKKVLKVLVVDIDPLLTKGELFGTKCAGLTASACMGENKQQAINELINDIEYSSHGIIDVQIVKTEKLNEFATHTTEVTLLNGTKSHRLDEDTWLDIKKVWDCWNDKRYKELGDFTFDYDYLINKLNLVERRNNGEFNEVWLVNVDPTKSFESMMVGKSAYWINGSPNIKNCSNFRIMNVSTSRPDVNFECNGHAAENILNGVFNTTLSYNPNSLMINSNNYNDLNLWQKFKLTEHHNKNKNTGLSGVGDVHFSPNSISDYDWENYSNKVTSKWQEWLNYPNLTNNPSTSIFSPSVYMNEFISGTKSASRLHLRWWFSLMPHVTGYTNDGYSNNWWDYLYLSDFITSVQTDTKNYTYNVGDLIDNIKIRLDYKSLKSENITINNYENNMIFSNQELFSIDSNGKIVATSKGSSTLKYYRDGKSVTLNITIS